MMCCANMVKARSVSDSTYPMRGDGDRCGAFLRPNLSQSHCRQVQYERSEHSSCSRTTLGKDVDEILLIGLAERQSIDHTLFAKACKLRHVAPKGAFENVPLDLSAIEHPPRPQPTRIDQLVSQTLKT